MFFKRKNEDVVEGLEQRVHLLEQELKERETEIELLQDSAETVCRELNIQKVLQRVAQHAQKIISAETVLVPIVDENSKTYTYRAAYGKNADEIIGETLSLEFGVCGWVWKNRKPWWHGTIDKLEDPAKTQCLSDGKNVIMVPMIGKDGFLGGLSGINKTNGKRFTERDLHLLSLFAAQAGIAIENASNFHCLNQAVQLAELLQKEAT
ncbi:MAG: GAF domain-containing protein, partial [Gammaproteobacteria bacterium]|nr:GAF domain-containing protein [Gammaproteobacteria bacterium]